MITKDNLCDLLLDMGYGEVDTGVYEKKYPDFDCSITVDYNKELIIYPEEKGFQVNDRTTSNFDENENFVVLECVDRLLTKGYRPEHIELERRWKLGHSRKSGKADIYVTDSEGKKCLFIIECKTYGDEYRKELKNIDIDGGQLFSYFAQARSAQWLILYASNFTDKRSYITESICSKDDKNDELLAKKDESIKLYKDASEASDLFDVWCETYGKRYTGDIVFNDNTKPYDIGIKPLTKNRLRDFEEGDKIVNKFEEILRHNNVSDKENAFNRLVALFICKLVDEEEKEDNDIVDFQYKIGTDTYETLQERLQKLHQKGMEKYMKEEIVYIPDEYAEKLIMGYTGQKRINMINDLKKTIKMLKFYTNNDFAFKDVHNEELFLQNGKILVEDVQLFQEYRIVRSEKLQLLGDLFENLLTKGFKQNEGQFFTPIPITRFIWNAIPTSEIINIEELVERYLSTRIGVKPNTKANYNFVKNLMRKEDFYYKKIGDVKTSDAKLFLIKLQQDGKRYSTVKTVRGVLRPAFQMAVDDDVLHKNPFGFELAGVVVNDSVTREALTRDQMRKFLKFVHDDNVYCKYYEVVYILFHTGMRISEFCGLTIKDVDLENRIVNIEHQLQRLSDMTLVIEPTKTSAGTRKIPVTEDVTKCFQAIIEDREKPKVEKVVDGYTGFLFLDDKGLPLVAMHWEHRFNHMVKRYNDIYRVQMPNITPHVCRHTYCSNMAKSGMNPKTLQYLMGHSDIGVTLNTYTHLGLEDAEDELKRLEDLQNARKELERTQGEKTVSQKMFKAI